MNLKVKEFLAKCEGLSEGEIVSLFHKTFEWGKSNVADEPGERVSAGGSDITQGSCASSGEDDGTRETKETKDSSCPSGNTE